MWLLMTPDRDKAAELAARITAAAAELPADLDLTDDQVREAVRAFAGAPERGIA